MTGSVPLEGTAPLMPAAAAQPVRSPLQPPASSAAVADGIVPPGSAGAESTPLPDFEKLAFNAARFIEQGGKALSAYLKPFETGKAAKTEMSETIGAAARSIGKVAEHWLSNPGRAAQAQAAITVPFVQLWGQTYRRLNGEAAEPVVPLPKDKRFAAPEWSQLPVYEFLRQAHAITTNWADKLVDEAA